MTDSNLVRLAYVEESTWGVTPATPNMRNLRYTGESLNFEIETIESSEILTDRQVTDLIQTNARDVGSYNFELSYLEHDETIAAAFWSTWSNNPQKDNAVLGADTEITDAGTVADTYAVNAGGASFVVGMLVRASGFTNSANNKVFRVSSNSATTVVGTSLGLVAEAAPPATARLKVVGFQGASGDIAATLTGLSSTVLDFTTFGLRVGQMIKIGGTAAGDKYNTVANNDWVRINTIAANALTLDNLPTGWAADAGAGKTIRVWIGDGLSNGATQRSFTIEKGFLGQQTPNYLVFSGLTPDTLTLTIAPGSIVNGSISFLGKAASAATTTPLDASVTPSYGNDVINAVANVGRIAENNVTVTGPNYVQQLTIEATNNLREQTAVGNMGLVGVGKGQFRVTGTFTTYFGDATMYTKLVNAVATSISVRFQKGVQAYVLQLPKIKLSGGTPQAGGSNQDVVLAADYTALKDTALTQKTILLDRFEYTE